MAANVKSSLNRLLSSLTLIEHSSGALSPSNLNTLTAAKQLGGPITALVAGSDASKIAAEVAKFDGVDKVLVANNEAYDKVWHMLKTCKNAPSVLNSETNFFNYFRVLPSLTPT